MVHLVSCWEVHTGRSFAGAVEAESLPVWLEVFISSVCLFRMAVDSAGANITNMVYIWYLFIQSNSVCSKVRMVGEEC